MQFLMLFALIGICLLVAPLVFQAAVHVAVLAVWLTKWLLIIAAGLTVLGIIISRFPSPGAALNMLLFMILPIGTILWCAFVRPLLLERACKKH